MVEEQLYNFFTKEGYEKISSNLPEFTFYFHVENSYVNIFHVVNCERNLYITEDQYRHTKDKIKGFFAEKNTYDIHVMSLIICDDMEKAKRLSKDDAFCWMIDPFDDRLIIYENRVDDFYGMKNKMEYFLAHPSSYEQKKDIPYVTAFFVLANILIFLLCTFSGDLLYNKGDLSASAFLREKEYYRILTSAFLHWDIHHLVSNMLVLYYLGEVVEKYFGRVKYGIIYILSGVLGNIVSVGCDVYRNMYIRSAGASGAVFGITGALFVLVCIHKGHLEQITMHRLLVMIVYSLYSGFVGSNINNAAHIGGFISGAVIAFLLWNLGKNPLDRMRK